MKKRLLYFVVGLCMTYTLMGCGKTTSNPGIPPEEVIQGSNVPKSDLESENVISNNYDGAELVDAVTISVGRDNGSEYNVTMYNNAAANTMLGYLSSEALLFPTYTYEEEGGFSAQNVRGSYTREDEVEIRDVHEGELYLFSDGQLRLYFKDVNGAEITATPIGYITNPEGIEEAVTGAYEYNQGDIWGVDVYYWITKH